jgi:Ca2+-binding EF-hand superfamily protein
MFDDQNCGSLDFREFLTCFSVLLRGTFSKKLELFFTAFGSKQHKYLNQEEFMILLNVLFNSYINQQDNDEQLRQ